MSEKIKVGPVTRSPWAKDDLPPPQAPAPRPVPDPAVFLNVDDSRWAEGWEAGYPERIERRLLTGESGEDRGKALDRLMRHGIAEMNQECHKMTGTTLAQVQNPEFWRSLMPCRTAVIDVAGMFLLRFSHDDETMTARAEFPEDVSRDGFTAWGASHERLVASIKSELREWAAINRPGD